jgi:hypothetical protein
LIETCFNDIKDKMPLIDLITFSFQLGFIAKFVIDKTNKEGLE